MLLGLCAICVGVYGAPRPDDARPGSGGPMLLFGVVVSLVAVRLGRAAASGAPATARTAGAGPSRGRGASRGRWSAPPAGGCPATS